MTKRLSCLAAAALLLAAACSDSTKPVATAASIATTKAPAGTVGVGTSAGTFIVKVADGSSSALAGVEVAFTATGSGSVSPVLDTTDAAGLAQTTVSASGSAGQLTVVATVAGSSLHTDAVVTVLPPATGAPCTSGTVGGINTYQNVLSLCLTAAATDADYTVIAFNSDTVSTRSTTFSTTGAGTPPSASLMAPSTPLAYRGASPIATTLTPDHDFHVRLRERASALVPRIAAARAWQGEVQAARRSSGTLAPSGVSRNAIPGTAQVGDLLKLNTDVNGDCTTNDLRTVRVMAIGTRSIVMADTANPKGGFTADDYIRFAARFDTLVYPLDVGAFGGPSDIDNNGKVGILFTRAVNEYTKAGSSSYVAGFFADRDLFPKTATTRLDGCGTSNEAEMFYMLAPDPAGEINGNVRTTALVTGFTTGTITHEFQHLINASRRLYVNRSDAFPESTWLNEGLSHEAEELLYYREAAREPRRNLTDANIRLESSANYTLWKDQQSQNFQRYSSYLSNPSGSSPIGANDKTDDELSTRGGIWSLLRYAADRFYTADGDVWYRLVNSTTSGLNTLRLAFGSDPVGVIRDWTIANYLDDSGYSTDPKYQHLSWNYRDIYTKTFTAGVYPLKVTGLASGASVPVSVKRASAGYYRLTVPANRQAVVNLSSTGGSPSPSFQFIVIRTR